MHIGTIIFFAFMAAVLPLHAYAAILVHSIPKDYTGPECNVKSYAKKQAEDCGFDYYVSKRSSLCPAERYNSRDDLSCPGSDPGGRVIRASFTTDVNFPKRITWPDDNFVHGNENIKDMIGNSVNFSVSDVGFGAQYSWSRDTNNWSCRASGLKTGGPRSISAFSGSLHCVTRQILASCEKPEFGIAVEGLCALPEFGKVFKTCDDLTQVKEYNTCQLRKTAAEIDAYIDATESHIDFFAQQLAIAQGRYILGAQQAKLASCLIARYETDILYEDIVRDLKNNYSAMFGFEYEPAQFDCSDTKERVEYTYNGKTCDNFSANEIAAVLVLPTVTVNERNFYELCQQKIAAETLTDWFKFHMEEADLLLNDLIARSSSAVAGRLSDFRNKIKKVNTEAISCESCRVTQVETADVVVSTPIPPSLDSWNHDGSGLKH